MKVLSHVGEFLFMVEFENKYYRVSIAKKTIIEVEDPDEIYRQGYWEAFKGKLNKSTEEAINDLLKPKR